MTKALKEEFVWYDAISLLLILVAYIFAVLFRFVMPLKRNITAESVITHINGIETFVLHKRLMFKKCATQSILPLWGFMHNEFG